MMPAASGDGYDIHRVNQGSLHDRGVFAHLETVAIPCCLAAAIFLLALTAFGRSTRATSNPP